MENHTKLTDEQFETQFRELMLEPTFFTHEAHLRLAWIHIRKYGIDQAISNVCEQIKRFASHHGDHNKYNVTVTIAAVRAVYHFMLKSETNEFIAFIMENSRLKTNFKDLLGAHYSTNLFNSEEARLRYIEPELLPFD